MSLYLDDVDLSRNLFVGLDKVTPTDEIKDIWLDREMKHGSAEFINSNVPCLIFSGTYNVGAQDSPPDSLEGDS